jgi:hypothetical protein
MQDLRQRGLPKVYETREMMYGSKALHLLPMLSFACRSRTSADMERHYCGVLFLRTRPRAGRVTRYFMGLRDRNLLVGKSLAGGCSDSFPARRPRSSGLHGCAGLADPRRRVRTGPSCTRFEEPASTSSGGPVPENISCRNGWRYGR